MEEELPEVGRSPGFVMWILQPGPWGGPNALGAPGLALLWAGLIPTSGPPRIRSGFVPVFNGRGLVLQERRRRGRCCFWLVWVVLRSCL